MPSITKAEYNRLKLFEERYKFVTGTVVKSLEFRLEEAQKEAEKWKRYYDAVRETFKVDETVEIPGCFSPMDTVKFIVEQQEKE